MTRTAISYGSGRSFHRDPSANRFNSRQPCVATHLKSVRSHVHRARARCARDSSLGVRALGESFSRVEWTRCLPESGWQASITEFLDLYQAVAADGPQEANTFKFYQMEVMLTPAPRPDKL
jgi:hypothetical protein